MTKTQRAIIAALEAGPLRPVALLVKVRATFATYNAALADLMANRPVIEIVNGNDVMLALDWASDPAVTLGCA